ncbi:hypothetical protein XCCB100_0714 [Xanthomonas campestris pv. campestris]|uniref:Uncharacterized protein n=1 Tax=Xanthomonas campestris pv. campestris (strain B100) TaxID=509169 RepID=B0RNL8_XANCB|nr:hypothetical protein XCCB100_0714 [Xanthomonas campestris pv. campestris]
MHHGQPGRTTPAAGDMGGRCVADRRLRIAGQCVDRRPSPPVRRPGLQFLRHRPGVRLPDPAGEATATIYL